MMRAFVLLFLLAGMQWAHAQTLTLENIWNQRWFSPQRVPGFQAMASGTAYAIIDQNQIKAYDFIKKESQGTRPLLLRQWKFSHQDKPVQFSDYQFSPSENWVILTELEESIYRYSTKGKYWLGNATTGQAWPWMDTALIQYPSLSPDEKWMSFVLNNNLYIKEIPNGNLRQLTFDGRLNAIINGASDWVYEEEFETVKAYEWSSDGRYLAFLRFDEAHVESVTMEYFYANQPYSVPYTFKYPKVGAENARVTVHVLDIATMNTFPVPIPGEWEYFPRIFWFGDQLTVLSINRLQNEMTLWAGLPGTSMTMKPLYVEKSTTYIELPAAVTYLPSLKQWIITSEKDGFRHLYLYDHQGKLVRQLTSGTWEVSDYLGFHAKSQTIYFTATKVHPTQKHLYAVDLKGKLTQITTAPGYHQPSLCGDFFLNEYSRAGQAPQYTLYTLKGQEVLSLERNQAFQNRLDNLGLSTPEWMEVPGADGTPLHAWFIKPHRMQPNKKYPLLMFVYGGPGSQQVLDRWGGTNYGWFQLLAQRGIAVACVDNRGTGGRGKDFKAQTYGKLGELETQDQVAAAQYFGTLPYINADRIGVFGWSYGGYMAALCMTNGKGVFRAGISVAPVTNWKYYDAIYTERYMGTMATNPKGFDAQSPVRFAAGLQNHFLLVHGAADDNVHWQNTAVLTDALVQANKDFDLFIYPNKDHGIYGGNARLHLYRKMTQFLEQHLSR